MFHQIFIQKEDRNAQRFLWRGCNENKEPDVYMMNVLIFGASCAPCISQYVKNLHASKFENEYPEAAVAIKDNHYVDDFLVLTDSAEEDSKLAKEVRFIHNQAGFNIRNWCSNSDNVLQELKSSNSNNNICLNISDGIETEKVLGVFWIPGDDVITFKLSLSILNSEIFLGQKEPTKREVLKILMKMELKEHNLFIENVDTIINIERFSRWCRVLRSTAFVIGFCNRLKIKKAAESAELTQDELLKAELVLLKQAQQQNDGVLRVAGRIENADVPDELKHPAILPKHCRITKLLILHYHNIHHHINHETVVNELRQRYYIPKLRVVCRCVVRECQMCKVINVLPVFPQMAKLPRARLAAFRSPFTFTGLDFFGPLYVTVNRHKEKRYGALFTCLTVRAVHIEIVHSLNTSSCIMAIRNFVARRGQPREFFSDNGTNFVGAERELMEAIKEVNKNELVRNSRPLTYVPIESENGEAITPNHFLLGSSNGIKPLATYDDDGIILREFWLRCQQYADKFWKRWVAEYLPTLTCRTKWFEKAKPLAVGELVVVVDPANPRNVWPKGRVIEVYKSEDGQVRKAKVMTTGGILDTCS
ncbi:uncharacterized protein LOC119616475 [Lucilia sericata]|uniref:uncharacterized protein LOC119616475 n=1 Tax=Lucilia sericata TaxID=13632 RepID=UPI0018A81090|nr:uncharacterized protein LOC119616475 [Lucilia sericata]